VSLWAMSIPIFLKYFFARQVDLIVPLPLWLLCLLYLVFFNLNIEGNLAIDRYLNKKLIWIESPRFRLLVQLTLMIACTLITIVTPMVLWYYLKGTHVTFPAFFFIVFLANQAVMFLLVGSAVALNFFRQWKVALLKAEHLKHEKLKSDYRALQNQVNPHFLFNCLNVLISEINQDPASAEVFTRKLSLVYRYVLQSRNHELITLEKELEHLHAFIFLHQVRSGDALNLTIRVEPDALHCYLPPLTLQILAENAIKHTVMNEENPLYLSLETTDRALVVKNNLNPKESIESTGTGLSNIKARYGLLGGDGIRIERTAREFIVTVPLLEGSH